MERTFSALLTDLDGTLIHSQDAICEALHQSFLYVGATPPDKQAILDMFGLPVEVMLTTLTEVTSGETERIAAFIAEYKRQYPIHMVRATLIDHALDTLADIAAKGKPICLITSERRKNASFILNSLGLDRYIGHLISRDDVVCFKPDPEPLQKAAALLSLAPEVCAYIGESPFDIQAGVASGVFTVAVASGNWSAESLLACMPDLFVEDISALKALF